jgi:hypothetical protein
MKTNVASFGFGKKLFNGGLALLCLHLASQNVLAQAPTVSYTVSGTSGNYTLDFTVQDNFSASQYPGSSIYAFAVAPANADTINGSPAGFSDLGEYNPGAFGGPNINYFDNWGGGDLPAGDSVSGFDVRYTGATVPTSVEWMAYGVVPGANYASGGSFTGEVNNPGFDGTAGVTSAPDGGSTILLLSLGLAALGRLRRNQQQA